MLFTQQKTDPARRKPFQAMRGAAGMALLLVVKTGQRTELRFVPQDITAKLYRAHANDSDIRFGGEHLHADERHLVRNFPD